MAKDGISRRALLGGAAGLAGFAALPAWSQDGTTEFQAPVSSSVRNNTSSFRMLQWQDYFETTSKGVILVDITSRALHYWSEDQSIYRLYPTSVPLSEELTRRGRTEIVRKAVNPPWRPTASMLERNPDWPKFVEGGAKDNPLGVRGMYLFMASLFDPRHSRHPEDWPQIIERLHRPLQRACRRTLRVGAGRHAGAADLTSPTLR
jgi:hypothetical protein